MEIPKDKIIQMIKSRRGHDEADQAQSELPEQVEPEKDQGLLAKFGIDPKDLIGGSGGRSTPTTRPLRVLHPHP
jgi:hypothetical protein